jgi:hypothetical protein
MRGWRGSSPTVPFERYVDDVVVHCGHGRQARELLAAIESTDGTGRAAVAIPTRPGSSAAEMRDGGACTSYTSFTFWGRNSAASGAEQARAAIQRILDRDH